MSDHTFQCIDYFIYTMYINKYQNTVFTHATIILFSTLLEIAVQTNEKQNKTKLNKQTNKNPNKNKQTIKQKQKQTKQNKKANKNKNESRILTIRTPIM